MVLADPSKEPNAQSFFTSSLQCNTAATRLCSLDLALKIKCIVNRIDVNERSARDSLVAHAHVERALQKLFIVCACVQVHSGAGNSALTRVHGSYTDQGQIVKSSNTGLKHRFIVCACLCSCPQGDR
jgi:hypothetical protein